MTSLSELNQCPCGQIDASGVNAYTKISLTPENPSTLELDTSWDNNTVDLTPAVKNAETVTHLFLTPEDNPVSLQFNREDYGKDGAENGGVDCITGDELSGIISMTKLKDVSGDAVSDGDVYMYDDTTQKFIPYDLNTFVENTNEAITNLENITNYQTQQITTILNSITNLQDQINTINQTLQTIQQTIARPDGTPTDTRIVYGNINLYSDSTNTNQTTSGFYTHSTSTQKTNDEMFS